MSKPAKETEPSAVEKAQSIIRTATALTRYPIHRLTKHGEIAIKLKIVDEDGQLTLLWEVSHNSKYGQPGPLAYKLDTLIINRRIEEAGYPLPEVLKIGSLSEICRELGIDDDGGKNRVAVREALYQNASAMITAQAHYTGRDKSKRLFEFGTTRYGVILTGEQLPDGRKADAVYITLHLLYRDLLDKSQLRPLDYAYLKALKQPMAQRFYELLSFQIYGALESRRERRAKYLYSEFCQQAPQQRYFQFKRMHMQMKEVHALHLASGYIQEPVEFRETTDSEGRIDWEMFYAPGPKARAEYRTANARSGTRVEQPQEKQKKQAPPTPQTLTLPFSLSGAEPLDGLLKEQLEEPLLDGSGKDAITGEADDPATGELIALLVEADLNRSDAERFARERPEVCRRQLEYLPHVKEFKSSRGAYLRRAIEGDFGAPTAYARQQSQQQARQKAEAATQEHRAQGQAQASQEKARRSHEDRFQGAYEAYVRERVGDASKTQPGAFAALERAEAAQRSTYTTGPLAGRPLTLKALEVFDQEASRLERAREFWCQQGVPVLGFWEWDEALNLEPFSP